MPDLYADQIRYVKNRADNNQIIKQEGNDILVLVYSLTGNTQIMANMIATHYQADLIEIVAEEYSDDFSGRNRASSDAWNEGKDSTISPLNLDLSRYRLIFLGSPIWWYRPAVPLWTFTEKNLFQGQRIILFNTFNSRFKDKYINEFSNLVKTNGGRFNDHIYIRRGRWYNQLDQTELIEQIRTLLKSRETDWQMMSKHLA